MIFAKVLVNIAIIFSTILLTIRGEQKDEHRNWALDGVKVRLEKVLCDSNPKYCTVTTCNVKFKSREVANMNMIATIERNITVMKFNTKSYYQFSNNEYRPMGFDVTVDYCTPNELSHTSSSSLMTLIKNTWRNKTNIFQPCPIMAGEYYLKDWNFAASDLPNIIPAGRYLLKTVYHTEFDDLSTNTSIYFNVVNHGILDMNIG